MHPRLRRLVEMIDRALKVPETDLHSMKHRWVSMSSEVNGLSEIAKKFEAGGELRRIVAEVESSAARFMTTLKRANDDGRLRAEWERFAFRDAVALKDWLLGLRDYLLRNEGRINVAMLRHDVDSEAGVDPEHLFWELRRHCLIGETVWMRFRESFARSDKADGEISKRVRNIALLFLEIIELRGTDNV
ncbi:MAG: hypothetical protein QXG10_03205 [Candidatus Hadarchaeales archaeon]